MVSDEYWLNVALKFFMSFFLSPLILAVVMVIDAPRLLWLALIPVPVGLIGMAISLSLVQTGLGREIYKHLKERDHDK